MQPPWPYTRTKHDGFGCFCGTPVTLEYDKNADIYSPKSRYWSVSRREVYCSAEHSLERHERKSL